ncbi:MAG: protein-L-isoaspartate(D-aspartate) O-methyltransferase [Oceanicaulis sp.]
MKPAARRHVTPDVFDDQRKAMTTFQLARRGIETASVLEAMTATPREAFVPEDLQDFAYEDSPLPVQAGQTISQPFIVAKMIELAELTPGDTVLEIGAGTGYAAAVMSHIARKVFAIERHEVLADSARQRLAELDYGNVEIVHGDGTKGLPGEAPFDAIVISAGGEFPEALKSQIKIGGRIVIPLSVNGEQVLTVLRKVDAERFEISDHGLVRFVPLVADQPGPDAEPAAEAVARPQRSAAATVISEHAEPAPDDEALADLVAERFADRKIVCLGESTHGTSEFHVTDPSRRNDSAPKGAPQTIRSRGFRAGCGATRRPTRS